MDNFKTLLSKMEQMQISRYKLAKITGISSPDIYQALSGKKPMYPNWKKRIADALACSVDELFPKGGESDEQK